MELENDIESDVNSNVKSFLEIADFSISFESINTGLEYIAFYLQKSITISEKLKLIFFENNFKFSNIFIEEFDENAVN